MTSNTEDTAVRVLAQYLPESISPERLRRAVEALTAASLLASPQSEHDPADSTDQSGPADRDHQDISLRMAETVRLVLMSSPQARDQNEIARIIERPTMYSSFVLNEGLARSVRTIMSRHPHRDESVTIARFLDRRIAADDDTIPVSSPDVVRLFELTGPNQIPDSAVEDDITPEQVIEQFPVGTKVKVSEDALTVMGGILSARGKVCEVLGHGSFLGRGTVELRQNRRVLSRYLTIVQA